jgi:predicted anti-sigma-YlaC factor YlaD
MNCATSEQLLSRALDGELPANDRTALDAHLASCASCRALRDEWAGFTAMLQEPVAPVQTPEALWADVQRAIRLRQGFGGQVRLQGAQGREDEAPVFGWRLRWAGAILAVVMLGAYGIGLGVRRQTERVVAASAPEKAAEVEFVETDVPGASTMVYEDAETGWVVVWVTGMETEPDAPQGT